MTIVRLLSVAFLLGLFVVASIGARAADCDAPKPTGQISQPGSNVPPSVKGLSGVWTGSWTFQITQGRTRQNAIQCDVTYISVHDDQNAEVVECLGSLHELNYAPRCDKYEAKIANGELSYSTVTQSARSFKLSGAASLSAQSVNIRNTTTITQLQRE